MRGVRHVDAVESLLYMMGEEFVVCELDAKVFHSDFGEIFPFDEFGSPFGTKIVKERLLHVNLTSLDPVDRHLLFDQGYLGAVPMAYAYFDRLIVVEVFNERR